MGEEAITVLGAVIVAQTRASTTPAPRALPYLGLDHPSGTGFHLLDDLSTRGIFRKYELVLDLEAGLGAGSRWLAGRLGCRVVGTTRAAAEAAASAELTRRAKLTGQVRVAAADPTALPFADRRFTHVWALESLPRIEAVGAALAEAYRVLRPGGTIAVQDLVVAEPDEGPFATPDARVAALRAAGFTHVVRRDRTAEAAERSAQIAAARERLRRATIEPVRSLLAAWDVLAARVTRGDLRVVQILARRG